MAVLLTLSSVVCALSSRAQSTLPDRLHYVNTSGDMDELRKLYSEITEGDLSQLPDSSLCDYHYLGGYLCSENEEHERAIAHFSKAKHFCELAHGTHSAAYMQIMRAYGAEFVELGQYDEALGVLQEAIVKSMYAQSVASAAFADLIMELAECYEQFGWLNEVPNHLMDAWSFTDKEPATIDVVSYSPLWSLCQFYNRYEMYDKAIKVSDMIIDFITERGGPLHPQLAAELYFRANILEKMGMTNDAIEAYNQGVLLLEANKLEFDKESVSYGILGNLLIALVSEQRWEECEKVFKKLIQYCNKTGEHEKLNIAFSSLTYVLNQNGQYDKALKVNTELLKRNLSEADKRSAEFYRDEILYSLEVIRELPDLEIALQKAEPHSNEWFDAAFKLAGAYNRKHESERAMQMVNEMYDSFSANQEAKDEYSYTILCSLITDCLNNEKYDLALRYANECMALINSIPECSDRVKFECVNNLVVAKLKSKRLDGVYDDLKEAARLCLNVYGENSQRYSIVLHNWGRALQLDAKLDEAKQYYLAAINLHREVKGSPMPSTVKYLNEVNNQIVNEALDR